MSVHSKCVKIIGLVVAENLMYVPRATSATNNKLFFYNEDHHEKNWFACNDGNSILLSIPPSESLKMYTSNKPLHQNENR